MGHPLRSKLTYPPRITAIGLALAMLAGCVAAEPRTLPAPIVITATPPGIPTDPALTATGDLPEAQGLDTTLLPTDTPTITPTELIPPTGFAPPVFDYTPTPRPPRTPSPGSGGAQPTFAVPHTTNLLVNPGFEGADREVEFGEVRVVEGWQPYYCAKPYTPNNCHAISAESIGEDQNDPNLTYTMPEYQQREESFRIKGGSQSQGWLCEYRVCKAGVYQTFPTQPGQVCEVGAWVQSYSAAQDGDPTRSDLKTQDDRDNATWYIRVDPDGGSYAWNRTVVASRGFGYADGVYDRFALINLQFVVTGFNTTVYFENVRLWPLKHNESFIDDAFAYCYSPSPPPQIGSPFDHGLHIGTFQPVSSSGSAVSIEKPETIIALGSELWLYSAVNGAVNLQASSDGGITWTPKQITPVFTSTGEGVLIDASIYHDPTTGKFEMWYVNRLDTNDKFTNVIGHATSADGLSWQLGGTEPVGARGTPGAWDEERIDQPYVVKVNGRYYLFYAGTMLSPEWKRQIGCRTSLNGLQWTACPLNPVLSPWPEVAPFEANELENPSVIYQNGVWLMAYTGYGESRGGIFRIGLAASYDGLHWHRWNGGEAVHWTTDSTVFPQLYINVETNTLWLWYTSQGQIYAATAPITLP